jgi:hypothetical protein
MSGFTSMSGTWRAGCSNPQEPGLAGLSKITLKQITR